MRKYYRRLAKERLSEMGISLHDTHFGQGVPHSKERKLQRNPDLYSKVLEERKNNPEKQAVWRSLLFGKLAEQYVKIKRKAKNNYGRRATAGVRP